MQEGNRVFVASPEKNSQSWKPEDYVCKHGLDIFLIDLYTIPERRFYPLHSLATHEKQKFLAAGMLDPFMGIHINKAGVEGTHFAIHTSDQTEQLITIHTWWLIPLSKWLITLLIGGLTLLIPLKKLGL